MALSLFTKYKILTFILLIINCVIFPLIYVLLKKYNITLNPEDIKSLGIFAIVIITNFVSGFLLLFFIVVLIMFWRNSS